jgi:hypothetical protein
MMCACVERWDWSGFGVVMWGRLCERGVVFNLLRYKLINFELILLQVIIFISSVCNFIIFLASYNFPLLYIKSPNLQSKINHHEASPFLYPCLLANSLHATPICRAYRSIAAFKAKPVLANHWLLAFYHPAASYFWHANASHADCAC